MYNNFATTNYEYLSIDKISILLQPNVQCNNNTEINIK